MKKHITWVLVADSHSARILQSDGPGKGLCEVPGAEFEAPRSAGRDVYSDREGRSFDSAGEGRHAKEMQTSAEDQVRDQFVRRIVGWIERPARIKAFERLVLVADPKTLGALRSALSQGVRERVVCEFHKDLTKADNQQIADLLSSQILV